MPDQRITVRDVLQIVREESGYSLERLLGSSRDDYITVPRIVAYYAALEKGYGPSHIGRIMNRDHSTIVKCVKLVRENRSRYEPLLSNVLKRLEAA